MDTRYVARVVALILGMLLLASLVGYSTWTVYENALTPAALDQGSTTNTKPSAPGELSPTAARAVAAYGGEAVWKDSNEVDSTVTVGDFCFSSRASTSRLTR
jgi:hypothetical protein